jgi:hypothetical protein
MGQARCGRNQCAAEFLERLAHEVRQSDFTARDLVKTTDMAKKKVGSITTDIIMVAAVLGVGFYLVKTYILDPLNKDKGATSPGSQPGQGTSQTDKSVLSTITQQASVAQAQNPFYGTMYQMSPGDASIDANTANNLWGVVTANVTNYDDTDYLPQGRSNFSAVWNAFQSVVGNQVDISFVAYICQQQQQQDLLSFIQSNYTGADGLVIQQFIAWVNALPIQ